MLSGGIEWRHGFQADSPNLEEGAMAIDWHAFTPWASLAGGALVGLAAGLFAIANGRIAGISGLLGSLLQRNASGRRESGLFLIGLVSAPLIWALWGELPRLEIESNWRSVLLAGLLVGFGSRYGSGCTSGHGVCGLSRLTLRSAVATVTFMISGFTTVFFIRHVWGG